MNKLLIGKKAIVDHYGISDAVFYVLVQLGLPLRKINNRIYAWTDNIDVFLSNATKPGPPISLSDEEIAKITPII